MRGIGVVVELNRPGCLRTWTKTKTNKTNIHIKIDTEIHTEIYTEI